VNPLVATSSPELVPLVCPADGSPLHRDDAGVSCLKCGADWRCDGGVPRFLTGESAGAVPDDDDGDADTGFDWRFLLPLDLASRVLVIGFPPDEVADAIAPDVAALALVQARPDRLRDIRAANVVTQLCESPKAGIGIFEPGAHRVDDALQDTEDVQLSAVRIPRLVGTAALEQRTHSAELTVQLLELRAKLVLLREFGQDGPPELERATLLRRTSQQVKQMPLTDQGFLAPDARAKALGHETRHEQIFGEGARVEPTGFETSAFERLVE
jgi:hypothetical protein